MQFMDTHIHLQDFNDKNATDIIANAYQLGVNKFVCVSAKEKNWSEVEQLYKKHTNYIIPAFGLHPWHAENATHNWVEHLENMLNVYPNAAVGECGIDLCCKTNIDTQKKAFIAQINLAKKLKRTLIVHSVRAQSIIEELWNEFPAKVVFHSFNSNKEFARQICNKGYFIAFNFSILNNPHKAEIVRSIPLAQMLLETDSPYQPPKNNMINSPDFMPILLNEIAKTREEKPEKLAQQIYNNSMIAFEVK